MDRITDLMMTKLFQLAKYVCNRCSSPTSEPAASQSQQVASTIRFSDTDRMVEGELFK